MIREFSTKANSKNSNAKTAFFVLMALAVPFCTLYLLADKYKGIFGLVTMFFLVGAVYIYTRYIGVQYYYDITFEHTGEPLFVVRRVVGKNSSTLARVALAEITSIKRESRSEMKTHKTPFGYRKYFYTPTLFPDEVVRLCVISAYEKAEIVIEISKEYSDTLSTYICEAGGELAECLEQ